MGMKLKSGADLCGFQLTNFCVQGEASAPSDAALGRKYFHTNATDDVATGISLLHRERIYLGEGAWRATAYLDDIAAINEKLNLITGDTDTDTLINNLKDLEEFLKDFSETDKLKSLLDGKLDKSGGTISGSSSSVTTPLTINTTYYYEVVAIGFNHKGVNRGGVGLYANGAWLVYGDGPRIGIRKDGTPAYSLGYNQDGYDLIHSGNIGSYAQASYSGLSDVNLPPFSDNRPFIYRLERGTQNVPSGASYGNLVHFGYPTTDTAFELLSGYNSDELLFRSGNWNADGTGSLHSNAWKSIAFLDSNVAWSQGLKHSNGTIGAVVNSSGNVLIGTTTDNGAKLQVAGTIRANYITSPILSINRDAEKGNIIDSLYAGLTAECLADNIRFRVYKKDGTASNAMILHDTGAVTMSSTLIVGGGITLTGALTRTFQYAVDADQAGNLHFKTNVTNWTFNTSSAEEIIRVSGASKDVHIRGNLIVDGEISAGGAGAEEGTSGSGGAEGVSEIFTPTSTSMAFDHNLGEDVIVQVYEKSGNVWNMVMVDVEITSATRVTLRFGKTEATQHKVVIMGV